MSVDEDHDGLTESEFIDLFAVLFDALDEAGRQALVRRMGLQRLAAQKFSALAPQAWADLVAIAERTHERARDLAVAHWCEEHQLTSPLMRVSAWGTVVNLVAADQLGLPRPTTLTAFSAVAIEPAENGLANVGLKTLRFQYEPVHDITIPGAATVWRPDRETLAQFRTRAIDAFRTRLDEQLAGLTQAQQTRTNERGDEPTGRRVEWLILRRAAGRTERSIASEYGVSRNAVRKGEQWVAGALGLPPLVADRRS